ncbi:MAG: DEAD/DEAH box helicase [Armatimonadota bacterium]
MDFDALLDKLKHAPGYAGQIVYVREVSAREARYAEPLRPLTASVRAMLNSAGIERLYTHQAEALDHVRDGRDALIVTGAASGKSLCYILPIIEALEADSEARALLLFPTKALCQDQYRKFTAYLKAAGLDRVLAGVYDGDTPSDLRRRLRDEAAVIFSNPDMVHTALMPQHARWAEFLGHLRLIVLDELHVYSGIFGSNMANLVRRFGRVCRHYGSKPQMIACSATLRNPVELAERVTGRRMALVDQDGSPRGRRLYVFWNPPRVRTGAYRSRRSANVEAHELMALLVRHHIPTITFSKAKMTAEMIYRYVCERLAKTDPQLVKRVTPYRGGYLPQERREIERRLFDGELIGVSTTPALELGIDVGVLDASILVGYPGTLASFFQQSGRAGRQDRDALVILIGLDTAINQYVISNPEYLFGRPIESAVVDEDNPFVLLGHLRCATHELPLGDAEIPLFGPHAGLVLRVLEENRKVRHIGEVWYHTAGETPQHEVSLRCRSEANVVIEDADTGQVLGELDKFDSQSILHPGAIYMHQGDTYRVLELDLDRNIARVQHAEVDYYTQPLGGTDIHHIDHCLREKPFGTGRAYWGEVTAYFNTYMYERIHFYSLDAVSQHQLRLPTFVLETMAFWLVPPEELMEEVRQAGLDAHSGLRGLGYATRMLLPAFMTCDTLDFSHSVGSANSPWHTVFIYERYMLGQGFTEKAYDLLHEILPAVLWHVEKCPCDEGCPCCVGKPLRQYATWNVERHEAHIPSKAAALMILRGLLGDGTGLLQPDSGSLTDFQAGAQARVEQALRRRLERGREPQVFHPIEPRVATEYPEPEDLAALDQADVTRRADRRRRFQRELRRRMAIHAPFDGLEPLTPTHKPPEGMHRRGSSVVPTAFPGRPMRPSDVVASSTKAEDTAGDAAKVDSHEERGPICHGDPLASRARRRKHKGDGSDDVAQDGDET